MRYLLAFLLCFVASAQQTVNNFTVKTNLIVAGAPVTLSVNTIADLVALNPVADNVQVSVAGYYASGDGGGGLFQRVYSSGLTNVSGMIVISAINTNYAWQRILDGGAINVRWFGAKGNGIQDDTTAVQSAINFAETPTYGPGSSNLNYNTAAVEFTIGEYLLSSIVINKLSELRGIAGQSYDYNNGVVLKQKAGFIGPLISVTPSGSIWSFRKPWIHDLALLGQSEQNATNHVQITGSSSRLVFTVATNFLPEYNSAGLSYPWFGHCFFYGPPDGGVRRYLGSGWIQSINYTNGTITLRDQTDLYATPLTNGLSLGANMAVIFSPLKTNGTWIGYSGAYATAGNSGIWIEGTGNSRIENVNMEKFHCGIVFGGNNAVVPLANFFIGRSQFFNYGSYRAGANSDSIVNVGYLQGFYRTDYTLPASTLSITNDLYRRSVFNIFNPGFADDFSQVTLDSALVNHYQAVATDVVMQGGLNDNAVVGSIWLDGVNSMTNAFKYIGKTIRSPFLTSATESYYLPNTTNSTYVLKNTSTAFANAAFDLLSVHGVYSYINNNTNASAAPKLDYGFILPLNSYIDIGVLDDISAISTLKNGLGKIYWGATRNGVTSASVAEDNLFFPTSTSISYASGGNEMLRFASTGATFGYSTMGTAPISLVGGSGGGPLLSMTRGSQTFSIRMFDGVWRLYDDTVANTSLYLNTTSVGTQLWLGNGTAVASPRINCDILAERGLGTDISGSKLRIIADQSTGNANQPDAIAFQVGVAGASGSTLQTLTDAFVVEGDGDVRVPNGNFYLSTLGKGIQIKEGTNAKMGTATLSSGSAVVSTTAVSSTSRIFLTGNADGGTTGWLRVSSRTNGTSFVITSSSGTDSSTVAWLIVDPAP